MIFKGLFYNFRPLNSKRMRSIRKFVILTPQECHGQYIILFSNHKGGKQAELYLLVTNFVRLFTTNCQSGFRVKHIPNVLVPAISNFIHKFCLAELLILANQPTTNSWLAKQRRAIKNIKNLAQAMLGSALAWLRLI